MIYYLLSPPGERKKGLRICALLVLNKLISLRIEQSEKTPRRVTAMTYTCSECLGYRNFGMPEANLDWKTSGVLISRHAQRSNTGEWLRHVLIKNDIDISRKIYIIDNQKLSFFISEIAKSKNLILYMHI